MANLLYRLAVLVLKLRHEKHSYFIMTWDMTTGQVNASSNSSNGDIKIALTTFLERLEAKQLFEE